jgi:SseB protein C-terminal domain/SseB protein N-terminal domain
VLGTVEGKEDSGEQFTLEPGGKLKLVTALKDGNHFLPIFSSLPRMQDYVKQESKFLRVNGRALFELTRGAPVFLNPASEYCKEFSAQQVAQLLEPSRPPSQPRVITGEADYPVALVDMLTKVFADKPEVEAAWMIQVTFADRADQPHPLVGVEFGKSGGDWMALMRALEAAAQSLPGYVFDIQRIDRDNPNSLSDALLQVPPFYQRRNAGVTLN